MLLRNDSGVDPAVVVSSHGPVDLRGAKLVNGSRDVVIAFDYLRRFDRRWLEHRLPALREHSHPEPRNPLSCRPPGG